MDALASYGSTFKDPGTRYILYGHIETSCISKYILKSKVLPVKKLDQTNLRLHSEWNLATRQSQGSKYMDISSHIYYD